jgi:hypothetical protein
MISEMVMNTGNRFNELITQAKEVRRQNGTTGLLKAGIRLGLSPVYKSETFWLMICPLSSDYVSATTRPRISEDKLHFKVVTSNQEADKLEAEGFSFRSHPTYFNHYLKLYTRWLDYGAIACCTFVEKEFACINWIIPTKRTLDAIKAPPLKIDFANHEVTTKSAWTNPKYRGLELFNYTLRNRNQYLTDNGYTISKDIVDYNNKSGIGISRAAGTKIYGTGQRMRLFWWKFWKEKYFAQLVEWSEIGKKKRENITANPAITDPCAVKTITTKPTP